MLTLASDFGTPYPAAMKGVVLRRTDARLVDVAHDFPRQDVRAAAFWLREVLPEFPPAVHLVVVDPGVGTDRDALVVRAGDHALVGPDNGVLRPPARALAADDGTDATGGADGTDPIEAYVVSVDDPASTTFHGRDVFAPVAADVHEVGADGLATLDRLTPVPVADPVDLRLPAATVTDEGATGEVLVVDDFGNVITNVPGDVIADADEISVNGERVPVGETFASVAPGERLVTVGSHGYVECDVNRGRGDDAFGLAPGDDVTLVS
jgi:hypothetical protein